MARILVGIALLVFGLFWIGVYANAVLQAMGQPDRSIMFWALPVLFLGLAAAAGGAALIVIGARARR